jgi:tRNA dimethylallyltransferase
MFEEVERLAARTPALSRSASQSIGFKEILAGRAAGLPDEEIVARIQQGTRRFAKSQLTWFRRLPVEWIPVCEDPGAGEIARDILNRLGQSADQG